MLKKKWGLANPSDILKFKWHNKKYTIDEHFCVCERPFVEVDSGIQVESVCYVCSLTLRTTSPKPDTLHKTNFIDFEEEAEQMSKYELKQEKEKYEFIIRQRKLLKIKQDPTDPRYIAPKYKEDELRLNCLNEFLLKQETEESIYKQSPRLQHSSDILQD